MSEVYLMKQKLRKKLIPVFICLGLAVVMLIVMAVFFPLKKSLRTGINSLLRGIRYYTCVTAMDDPDEEVDNQSQNSDLAYRNMIISFSLAGGAILLLLVAIILFYALRIPRTMRAIKRAKTLEADKADPSIRQSAARSKWPNGMNPAGATAPQANPYEQSVYPQPAAAPAPIDSVTAQLITSDTEEITQDLDETAEIHPGELFIIEENIGYLGSDELIE